MSHKKGFLDIGGVFFGIDASNEAPFLEEEKSCDLWLNLEKLIDFNVNLLGQIALKGLECFVPET